MKTKKLSALSVMALCLVLNVVMVSCDESDDPRGLETKRALVVNSDEESPYDMALFDADAGAITLMEFDENNRMSSEDIMLSNGEMMASITFYDNGLVKSISSQTATLVFSNYNGNKVDIVIISDDDNMQLIDGLEGDVNWDQLGSTSPGARAPIQTNPSSDEESDPGLALQVSEWISDMNNNNQAVLFAVDQVVNSGVMYTEQTVKSVLGKLSGIITGGSDLAFQDKGIYLDSAKFLIELSFTSGPWTILYTMIRNYDTLEGWFTNMWLKFFEWKDMLSHDDNVELGLATLNSGHGALKVTLSWNFYADIDLHAIEPNGTRIYYNHEYSYRTGGYLDVDNRSGGAGAAENIYWENPENGVYDIAIDYFGSSILNGMSQCGMCKVTILYKGQGKVYNVYLNEDEYKNITNIDVPSGMLSAPATQPGPEVRLHFNRHKEPVTPTHQSID